MDPNIHNQIEEDQNEDDLWYDEDEDYERQKEAERENDMERAMMCTCGAWVLTKIGKVYHVSDCYCGAE